MLPGLVIHLDEEEEDKIVPLIDYHLTAGEYGQMHTSGHGVYEAHLLLMMFGAIVEQCTPADAAYMISHLPDDIQGAWYDHVADEHRRT